LISEVSSDYRKIGLRLILEKSVEKYSGCKKPEAKYDFYKIEAMQNYKEIQRKLHREILFVRREVHDALAKVITLCNEASSMTLISHRLDKCLTPEQFNSLQLQTAAKTIKYLKGQWLEKIINTVKICFREVGKGAFNIRQTDPWVYDVVKLKRLVNLIIQYMQ
ncbi:Similar to Dnah1: Dynein heavy chain 1, partial [Cotesia congregata]